MRLLKVLFAVLLAAAAVFAGVMVVAAIAVAGALALVGRRLLRRPASAALPESEIRKQEPERPAHEVIEVTATELPSDSVAK